MERVIDMAQTRRDAFGELLDAHRGIVAKVAGTYCRHPDDRADLAQEIATQLWRAWPGYDPARRFSTWMYRIALNVAISHVRGAAARPVDEAFDEQLHDLADEAGSDHEGAERVRLLEAFIARQAPLDRALLLLYLDERSQREIGEILGLSETNVSTKIGRLKQRLRDEL